MTVPSCSSKKYTKPANLFGSVLDGTFLLSVTPLLFWEIVSHKHALVDPYSCLVRPLSVWAVSVTQAPPAVSLEAQFAEPALVLLGLPQNWIVLVKILPKGNKLSCLPSGLARTRERDSRGVHRENSSSQKQHSFLPFPENVFCCSHSVHLPPWKGSVTYCHSQFSRLCQIIIRAS